MPVIVKRYWRIAGIVFVVVTAFLVRERALNRPEFVGEQLV
jgi:hypothetical protein